MNGRIFTIITAMVVFLVVAFTPIVPLMLSNYGIEDILIIKTIIGVLTLAAGYVFASALFNREDKEKKGVLHLRLIPLIIGVIIIATSWYTGLPEWIADTTGTNAAMENGGAEELITVGVRIWTSVLTLGGITLIRFGIYRKEEIQMVEPKKDGDRSPVIESIERMREKEW